MRGSIGRAVRYNHHVLLNVNIVFDCLHALDTARNLCRPLRLFPGWQRCHSARFAHVQQSSFPSRGLGPAPPYGIAIGGCRSVALGRRLDRLGSGKQLSALRADAGPRLSNNPRMPLLGSNAAGVAAALTCRVIRILCCFSLDYLSSTSTKTNSCGFGFTTLCSTPASRAYDWPAARSVTISPLTVSCISLPAV